MKTTLDLPSDLVDDLQHHAASRGIPLDSAAADLLRKGLIVAPTSAPSKQSPRVTVHSLTGLPVIECRRSPDPSQDLSPDQLAALLMDQEVAWHHEASR
jgi:hypothetical protein